MNSREATGERTSSMIVDAHVGSLVSRSSCRSKNRLGCSSNKRYVSSGISLITVRLFRIASDTVGTTLPQTPAANPAGEIHAKTQGTSPSRRLVYISFLQVSLAGGPFS